jgi:hypothetical protein
VKKNVAGQTIGAQMVSATDGSAFSGAVTVYVTGDAGTQAAGSVGSGACTHEGNGFHTYAPAQAETNYDHIAFTFIGTGAVPASVQVLTSFPQTGDNFARIGAPVGASISADVAAVQADTDNLQTRVPAALVGGRMDSSIGAVAAGVIAAASFAANALDAVWSTAVRVLTAATNITSTGGTTVAQTGDSYARLGAPAGASVSADIAAIEAQTDDIGVAGAGLTALATAAALTAVAAQATAIEADTQDLQARVPAALTAGGNMKADALAISGDTAAADALEGHLDGTTFMPVDAHKPNFAVVGTTLTVKQPDGATTAYTKTVSTDATAEPITGAS